MDRSEPMDRTTPRERPIAPPSHHQRSRPITNSALGPWDWESGNEAQRHAEPLHLWPAGYDAADDA